MKTKTFISLLRGINVSGQKKIRMAQLRDLYESLKFKNVRTYLQSGNVVFDCNLTDIEILSAQIEIRVKEIFGFPVTVFLRNEEDFKKLVTGNPFLSEEKIDDSKLHVTFLDSSPSSGSLENLGGHNSGEDLYSPAGREIYLFCPNGYGKTKLNNKFFERKLKMPATTRNWKTVKALFELSKA